MSSDGVNAWSQTLDDGDMPSGGVDGLYAVIVVGEDVTRNAGATRMDGRSGSRHPEPGRRPVGSRQAGLAWCSW